MDFFFLLAAPFLLIAAILLGVAFAAGGLPRVRAVGFPYLGPGAMLIWALLMQGRSRHPPLEVRDWIQGVLVVLGALGLLSAVGIFVRYRRARWRWMLMLNSLPLILLTAVVLFWGSILVWAGVRSVQ